MNEANIMVICKICGSYYVKAGHNVCRNCTKGEK